MRLRGAVARTCGALPRSGFLLIVVALIAATIPTSAQQAVEGSENPDQLTREFGISSPGPRLTLHGFADVTARYVRTQFDSGDETSESAFAVGELDLFIVSHLAENLSFLAEAVFESDQDSVTSTEVERMFIKYTVSDAFWVSLGRHHAPLGYWNETFHHGLILQPTVQRPRELQFEDHGGILPVHSVGLEAGGRWFRGSWGLEYNGDLGNGRGIYPREVQTTRDANQNKAITFRLRASHDGTGRVLFGPMVHAETIPPNPDVAARADPLEERIYGWHFVYSDRHLEILSEYFYMRHRDTVNGTVYLDPSYYVIVVGNPGYKWKPYAGYDRVAVDPADPYFADEPEQLKRFLLGVRWDLASFNALKFEIRHDLTPGATADEFIFQTAFTF